MKYVAIIGIFITNKITDKIKKEIFAFSLISAERRINRMILKFNNKKPLFIKAKLLEIYKYHRKENNNG